MRLNKNCLFFITVVETSTVKGEQMDEAITAGYTKFKLKT